MMGRYRQLNIELNVHHAFINPLDQGYDMAFAMLESSLPASTIVVRRIVSLERKLYAAPGFYRRITFQALRANWRKCRCL